MSNKSIGIIYNPTSGHKFSHNYAKKSLGMFNDLLSKGGYTCRDFSAGSAFQALTNVRSAIKQKEINYLIVFGGDGMVHLGFNAVAKTNIPLGIVPVGSGNDFAKAIKIPVNNIENVIRGISLGILHKSFKAIDCGQATPLDNNQTFSRTYFAGSLSAGLDAKINATANTLKIAPGPSRYFVAAMKELAVMQNYGYQVDYESNKFHEAGVLCCVSNSPYIGGGIMIAPSAEVDDGKLDLILGGKMNSMSALRLFLKAYKGLHTKDSRVTCAQVTKVILRQLPDSKEMPFLMADGEYVGQAPAEIEVCPKAVQIIFHPKALS
ncbi:MAG: diacylglycerol kinase family lipid kinase [Bifidobacteriaceae bacterium]|jgi:diacylglycerol kinase (ATP)|nr:diacylglycerol kinase family lipid kinase [Bifidobacteriaceae bacterium]